MRQRVLGAVLAAVAPLGLVANAGDPKQEPGKGTSMSASSVYDFTVKDIDGNDVALGKYKGDVLLIVNVASK